MSTILFIGAHQDDETLSMGAAVINHVKAGHRVCVGCVTDGRSSGIRGSQGTPSDINAFIKARNAEMIYAIQNMGASFIEGSTARLQDGTLSTRETASFPGDDGNDLRTVNPAVLARVRDLLRQASINTGVPVSQIKVKTHSHHDVHPDHRAVCQAVLYLLNVTKEISDVRLYVSPGQWDSNLVYKGKTYKTAAELGASQESNATYKDNIKTAASGYVKVYTTPSWGGLGAAQYGIGYLSVKSLFDVVASRKYSYYHVPPVVTMP